MSLPSSRSSLQKTPCEFKPFDTSHLTLIDAQSRQGVDKIGMVDPTYAARLATGIALSAFIDGECVASAGIVRVYPHMAVAWALLGEKAVQSLPAMVAITRKCRFVLSQETQYKRIELVVRDGHQAAERWAWALGFTCETPVPLAGRGPNGEAELIFARVRE